MASCGILNILKSLLLQVNKLVQGSTYCGAQAGRYQLEYLHLQGTVSKSIHVLFFMNDHE